MNNSNKTQRTSERRIMLDDDYFRALIARDGAPVIEIDIDSIKMNLLKQMYITKVPDDATLKQIKKI
jgi:hypothetical protein